MNVLAIIAIIILTSVPLEAQMRVDTMNADGVSTENVGEFQMTKSPMLALGLSAILPGAGQAYNRQWWKVPIIYAGIGGTLYGAFLQNKRYLDYRDSVIAQESRNDLREASRYRRSRDFYRDDRDKFYIYAGLIYVMNLLDAYISAHLFDFDVSDPAPLPEGTTSRFSMPEAEHVRFSLRYRF